MLKVQRVGRNPPPSVCLAPWLICILSGPDDESNRDFATIEPPPSNPTNGSFQDFSL